MNAEWNHYQTKKDEQLQSKKRNTDYETMMKDKSESYSEWWIYNKGDRARAITELYYEGKENKDPCFVNLYNKAQSKIVKYNLGDVLANAFKHECVTERHSNRFGQTRIWDDLYIATALYKFLENYWGNLAEGSSEC